MVHQGCCAVARVLRYQCWVASEYFGIQIVLCVYVYFKRIHIGTEDITTAIKGSIYRLNYL